VLGLLIKIGHERIQGRMRLRSLADLRIQPEGN
jgi:hypothetical protein